MSIRRGPKPDRFVILPNELAREQNLSFRARGLLAYLLSMPEDWRTNSNQLAGQSPKEGRDAIRSALTELEHAGYLKRRRLQDADGRWRTETIVTDSALWMRLGRTGRVIHYRSRMNRRRLIRP
jgi:hypothetical protein